MGFYGCGGAALASIQITPANSSIPAGSTQQLKAVGSFQDGNTLDITNSVTWSSSDTNVATINSAGLLTAHSWAGPRLQRLVPTAP